MLRFDICSSLLLPSAALTARAWTRFLTTLAWNWHDVGHTVVILETSKNMTSDGALATRVTSVRPPIVHAYSVPIASPGP